MSEEAKHTPLHDVHVGAGARMVDFGGWRMPLQYTGILAEHEATRTAVAMFDTCHMGRIMVEGPRSREVLSSLVTVDVDGMQPGRCRYGFLLNDDAGILDDLIAYALSPQSWMLVVNAGTAGADLAWIASRAGDASVTDITTSRAKLDVQGPNSKAAVEHVLGTDLTGLRYFRFTTCRYGDGDTLVSRTGYTGELGYEIYVEASRVQDLWAALSDTGVLPAGLGARDTLRLEAGLPLYGHELTESVTPAEAGMHRYASKTSAFIGKDALHDRLAEGLDKRLVGFTINGRQSARHGNPVRVQGLRVGEVTSGSFAPTLGCSCGMAYVECAFTEVGSRLEIDTGRKRLDAKTAAMPFYRKIET